jgi:hypothetical protein
VSDRLFLKDDADKTKMCFYCGDHESHGVDHCMKALRRIRATLATVQAELEAARTLRAESEAMARQYEEVNRTLQRERDALREALVAIEEATCWTGDARRNCHHMGNALRDIARRALAATPPLTPEGPSCEACGDRKYVTLLGPLGPPHPAGSYKEPCLACGGSVSKGEK